MKNQLRILFMMALTVFGLNAFSQSFGIKAGLNISNFKESGLGTGITNTYNSKFGFHVGLTTEFGKSLSFAPEILLSTKGATWDETVDMSAGSLKFLYLDIPLNLKYTYDMGAAKIFGTFGPYIGILLTGKAEVDGSDPYDFIIGSDPETDDVKRTDIGLGFGGGLQFNKITVGLSYGFSLVNTSPVADGDEYVSKNTLLAVSVGYKFK